MEWCVCKNKITGHLFVMERGEREISNSVLIDLRNGVPALVVKTFGTKEEALSYIDDINFSNEILNKIL